MFESASSWICGDRPKRMVQLDQFDMHDAGFDSCSGHREGAVPSELTRMCLECPRRVGWVTAGNGQRRAKFGSRRWRSQPVPKTIVHPTSDSFCLREQSSKYLFSCPFKCSPPPHNANAEFAKGVKLCFEFTARCFVGIHYKVSCMGLISALPVLYHLDEHLDRRLDMARISEKSLFRRVMFKQTQALFRSRLGFTCLRCVIRESTLTSSRTRTEFSSLLIFTLNPIRNYIL